MSIIKPGRTEEQIVSVMSVSEVGQNIITLMWLLCNIQTYTDSTHQTYSKIVTLINNAQFTDPSLICSSGYYFNKRAASI